MAPQSDLVRPATAEDAMSIAEIYNHYLLTSTITFEEVAVPDAEMAQRIVEVQASSFPWLVAIRDGKVAGFAYAQKWKARAAYRYAAEVTVYVGAGLNRAGIGSLLYSALLDSLRVLGMHAVIGGVALPNEASIRLHKKFGFEKVAHFKQVGFKLDRWVDVTYWQLTL